MANTSTSSKAASIDIGTNTVRLLIASIDEGGTISDIPFTPYYERAITRLGGAYTEEGGLDESSMERTISVLEGFAASLKERGVTRVRATATSVVRRACNAQVFVSRVKERTGITVEVIDGMKEAELSILGVLSVVDTPVENRLVMDIGGGSTEFGIATGSTPTGGWSMDMGAVHLTERYLLSDPPGDSELKAMREDIKEVIGALKYLMKGSGVDLDKVRGEDFELIGTAGTVTTLAALDQDLEVYDQSKINNYILSKEALTGHYDNLLSMKVAERSKVLTLEKGREDLIIAGGAVILEIMDAFSFTELRVSDAGLLEGILIDFVSGNDL